MSGQYKHLRIDWSTIEISNLNGMRRVSEVHDGYAALIPRLYFDIAAGDRNERTVMGHAVLAVRLGCGHLVVAREFQLIIPDVEDRISAPLLRIGSATARPKTAAPLVSEHDFLSIIRK